MKIRFFATLFVACWTAVASQLDEEETVCTAAQQHGDDDVVDIKANIDLKPFSDSCSLYLAPSTIPNAGLGVFTTKHLFAGDLVLPNGELEIPIVNRYWHTSGNYKFWPIRHYAWKKRHVIEQRALIDAGLDDGLTDQGRTGDGSSASTSSILFPRSVQVLGTGFDSSLNADMLLENVVAQKSQYDRMGLTLAEDVGASGITPFWNDTHMVTTDIPPGGELFNTYGKRWFEAREGIYGRIPFKEDYVLAQDLVRTFDGLNVTTNVKEHMWNDLVGLMAVMYDSRALNALPTFEDVDLVVKNDIRAFHQQFAIVSNVTELEANGRCMDNIVAGRSTIHQAGRGAFATRFLPRGSIVSGLPLLIVTPRAQLRMYRPSNKHRLLRNSSDLLGHQLLLNYCMGNSESELLLCPYATNVNFINHNQSRANLKLEWPKDGIINHNATFLQLPVEDLQWTNATNLAIDYVALRDIEPGEELFLDYGDAFEAAWSQYLERWNKSHVNLRPTAASFNEEMKHAVLKTQQEEEVNPSYPSHLDMECHHLLKRVAWKSKFDPSVFAESETTKEKGWPCHVLSRNESTDDSGNTTTTTYNIRIFYDMEREGFDKRIQVPAVRTGVPRSAIYFVDKVQVDFPANAFRHEIGIPEGIFPNVWRKRHQQKQE